MGRHLGDMVGQLDLGVDGAYLDEPYPSPHDPSKNDGRVYIADDPPDANKGETWADRIEKPTRYYYPMRLYPIEKKFKK